MGENVVKHFVEWITKEWLINIAVLCSMTMQVGLAFGGSFRHRNSNRLLQLGLWTAYVSADAVAIYALGSMAHSVSGKESSMFGIFAPMLLLHLGGPDSITAYSMADNELWTRHLVIMLWHCSVAAYVIYASRVEGLQYVSAILLFFVGAAKYAERTLALRCGSYSQIVSSSKPVYDYMRSGKGKRCQYLVVGAKQWEKEIEGKTLTVRRKVSIHDVWESEGENATDNYLVCLSHALFKMYRRRYANLAFFEMGEPDTRKFFTCEEFSHLPPPLFSKMLFAVIEMELKFLYDSLFSKSGGTAYSKWGVTLRILNISLLAIAGFLTFSDLGRGEKSPSGQQTVGDILISVGLILEFSQLYRVISSDWTMVWLICTGIVRPESKLVKFVIWLLGKVRKLRRRIHWKEVVHQYSVMDTCSAISPLLWNLAKCFRVTDLLIGWYIKASPIEDDMKEFIFERIKQKIPPEKDVRECKSSLTKVMCSLVEESDGEDLEWALDPSPEHLLLNWHIATAICEKEYNNEDRMHEIMKECNQDKRDDVMKDISVEIVKGSKKYYRDEVVKDGLHEIAKESNEDNRDETLNKINEYNRDAAVMESRNEIVMESNEYSTDEIVRESNQDKRDEIIEESGFETVKEKECKEENKDEVVMESSDEIVNEINGDIKDEFMKENDDDNRDVAVKESIDGMGKESSEYKIAEKSNQNKRDEVVEESIIEIVEESKEDKKDEVVEESNEENKDEIVKKNKNDKRDDAMKESKDKIVKERNKHNIGEIMKESNPDITRDGVLKEMRFENVKEINVDNRDEIVKEINEDNTVEIVKESNGDNRDENVKKYVRFSRKMSRYCAYLMASRNNLIPVHPQVAQMLFIDLHSDVLDGEHAVEDNRKANNILRESQNLAKKLLKKPEEQCWKIIVDTWADVLINYAVLHKAEAHAQYQTAGGEFLTELWVLIGHLGCGEEVSFLN